MHSPDTISSTQLCRLPYAAAPQMCCTVFATAASLSANKQPELPASLNNMSPPQTPSSAAAATTTTTPKAHIQLT